MNRVVNLAGQFTLAVLVALPIGGCCESSSLEITTYPFISAVS